MLRRKAKKKMDQLIKMSDKRKRGWNKEQFQKVKKKKNKQILREKESLFFF